MLTLRVASIIRNQLTQEGYGSHSMACGLVTVGKKRTIRAEKGDDWRDCGFGLWAIWDCGAWSVLVSTYSYTGQGPVLHYEQLEVE